MSGTAVDDALAPAVAAIGDGGVVLYPTMTLWGLGGDARRAEVVRRIAELKGRGEQHPFLLLVDNADVVEQLADVPAVARRLMDALWPGPLTLLLPAKAGLPAQVVGPTGLVGLRLPEHPVAVELVRRTGAWLVSTSANPTGAAAPTAVKLVDERIVDGVDAVAPTDREPAGQPSTIVAVDAAGEVRVVREGALSVSRLNAVINAAD